FFQVLHTSTTYTLSLHDALPILFPIFAGLALVFGVLLIIPIGGADMPTVIALLNAYAGLSACAMGFALDNHLLVERESHGARGRSEEHTSELQSQSNLVCRPLLE